MRTTLPLKLSVAANALLIGLLLLRTDHKPRPPVPVSTTAVHQSPPSAPAPTAASGDWRDAMSELRRVGVPSAIIAKVVVEKIAQKWTPIEADLERKYLHGEIDVKQLAEYHDKRAREQENDLRAALGEGFLAWDRETTVGNMYLGGLVPSEEQKAPLHALEKEWLARVRDLESNLRNGAMDQATFDATRATAEHDYKLRLAAIIGRDRVDLPADPADKANGLRRDFALLKLGDEQMNQLTSIHEKWKTAREGVTQSVEATRTVDAAARGDLDALDRARDEEYRRVMGNELFTAWQRAGDDRFVAMRENSARWNLDEATIARVYADIRAYDLVVASREYRAQIAEQSGESVDWAAVQASVANYSRQTEAALRSYLDDARLAQLREAKIILFREADLSKSNLGARPNL
jgi:hypothetical protein